jgi:phage baseplate assembly protein W
MATLAKPTAPTPEALFGIDLRLQFQRGAADLSCEADGLRTVSGLENLVQALSLRLLVDRGDLSGLGHPRYGSRIRDLIGERMDRPNRELIRRYVRRALIEDARVEEVVEVVVTVRADAPDSVDVRAVVKAIDGRQAQLQVTLDAR